MVQGAVFFAPKLYGYAIITSPTKEKEMGEPISNLNFADYFEALSFVMIADFFLAALFL